jgi:hypothetical protein
MYLETQTVVLRFGSQVMKHKIIFQAGISLNKQGEMAENMREDVQE